MLQQQQRLMPLYFPSLLIDASGNLGNKTKLMWLQLRYCIVQFSGSGFVERNGWCWTDTPHLSCSTGILEAEGLTLQ